MVSPADDDANANDCADGEGQTMVMTDTTIVVVMMVVMARMKASRAGAESSRLDNHAPTPSSSHGHLRQKHSNGDTLAHTSYLKGVGSGFKL